MRLLLDIGNTHTHLGLASDRGIRRHANLPTQAWNSRQGLLFLDSFVKKSAVHSACLCSVVPQITPKVARQIFHRWKVSPWQLTHENVVTIGIDYPDPASIGPDRLANAIAARHYYGAPSVVVDFGTAVTFDVLNAKGNYIGGIIAPGLNAMTSYLHEKTALLPSITIRETKAALGKNTTEAMLIGAVHGYRGLIKELLRRLKSELRVRRLPVVATGGYAKLISSHLKEIGAVDPLLTLQGLRLVAENRGL